MNIKGKRVTIVGGKRSGMALARLVTALGGKAKISELGPEESFPHEFRDWAKQQNVVLECQGHSRAFVEDSDIVVVSPGVRFDAPPVQWANENGTLVLGEVEFASQFCDKPIIAITGSNGKTTVSTLIRDMIVAAGHKACLCGNIGSPLAGFVLDLAQTDYVVLEISSFQLESVLDPVSPFRRASAQDLRVKGFQPHIAVLLNFNQNHLDRHKDLEEYFQAKMRLFLNQDQKDFAVLNAQDPKMAEAAKDIKSWVVYFNTGAPGEKARNPNHLAVLEVGRILGIDDDCCEKVFREFKGVEHRLESVRCLDGIDFINDSKATTAEAGMWALQSLNQPILMICGGRDKNIDFSVLSKIVQQKVKRMYAIGEARKKIRQTFEKLVDLQECSTLEEAVLLQARQSAKGDCVLLSPMCASFDMFKDYEDRGRVFKDIVRRLT